MIDTYCYGLKLLAKTQRFIFTHTLQREKGQNLMLRQSYMIDLSYIKEIYEGKSSNEFYNYLLIPFNLFLKFSEILEIVR